MSASCVSGTVAGASVLTTPYLCHRMLDPSTSFPTFVPSVHGLKRSFIPFIPYLSFRTQLLF